MQKEYLKKIKVISILANLVIASSALSQKRQCLEPNTLIPKPTGEYCVTATEYYLEDTSRREIFTENPNDFRELYARVYLPSESNKQGKSIQYASKRNGALNSAPNLKTHTTHGTKAASSDFQYPVILFSPGFTVIPAYYTSFYQELASHGYIVIAIAHPFFSGTMKLSSGEVVGIGTEEQTASPWSWDLQREDMVFVFDHFAKNPTDAPWAQQADWSRFAAVGHSQGAIASYEVGHDEARTAAVIALDGDPFTEALLNGIKVPFLHVQNESNFGEDLSKPPCTWDLFKDRDFENCSSLHALLKNAHPSSYLARFPKTNHMSFSDFPLLSGKTQEKVRLNRSISDLMIDFLDIHMKNKDNDDYKKFRKNNPTVFLRKPLARTSGE